MAPYFFADVERLATLADGVCLIYCNAPRFALIQISFSYESFALTSRFRRHYAALDELLGRLTIGRL